MKKSLLTFLFTLSSLIVSAQITASDSVGCAPMVGVQFTGIAGATGITWNFDDGGFANIENPVHTFSTPGTYDVTFTGTVNGTQVNHSLQIKVFGKPTPKFTTVGAVNGCAPLSVTFDNQSVGSGGAPITAYNWAFGDGGISNVSDPVYAYTIKGQYSVTLKVTDANGCDSSTTITNLVTVSQKPVPVITSTPDPIAACNPPLQVTYNASASTSNSPIGNTLTYSWTFGNGNTSTSATPPAQNYTNAGNFFVTLIVKDNNNCSDSIKKPININNPFASFLIGDTVCNQVTFDHSASTAGTYLWDYGDGSTGSGNSHNYANPGTYFVKLTVSAGTCSDDTIRKIVIMQTKAQFTISPTYTCSLPQTVNITNTSLNAYQYSWKVDTMPSQYDVTLSSLTSANPVITVTLADTSEYTVFDADSVINILLTVTSRQGCIDSIRVSWRDTIFLPTARYQPDLTEGCAPLTVQFSDSSASRENIVSWKYLFGDGQFVTSATNGNATHTYTTPGVYYPRLIITNSRGCTDTSYVIPITVGGKPTADFTASPTSICVHEPIQFTDQSTAGATPIDTWHYYTDNGFIMSSCFNDPNPSWSFQSGTGAQTVTYIVCSYGCCDTITKPGFLDIKGPLMEYTATMDCGTPDVFNFKGNFKDATSWTWNFGDGNIITNSTDVNISHTYAASGIYNTSVIGFNASSGCDPDTFNLTIHVADITAAFTSSVTGCTSKRHLFDASASLDVHEQGKNGYVWLWDDNTPPGITSKDTITHVFSTTGIHTVKLVVTDYNNCRDTIEHTVRISEVDANFNPDKLYGCVPWNANFFDLSSSDTTITAWNWTFGDGGIGTGDTTAHTFTNQLMNQFDVTLVVTNILGCTDTIKKTLIPSKPVANFFILSSTQKCTGDSVRVMAAVNNHQDYLWNFGDGGTDSLISPWHTYNNPGSYTVSLTVTDSIGCQKTNTIPGLVQVQAVPSVGFYSSVDTLTERCYPLTVSYTDTSIANIFWSRQWDLGNGSPVVANQTVGTIYEQPGVYTTTLIVSTSFGCRDTLSKTIRVDGPVADFTVGPTKICKGQSVDFQIKDTADVAFYHWDFGDGFDTTEISPVTHTYDFHPPNGQVSATLIYWGPDSTCAKTMVHTVEIQKVIADFTRNTETAVTDTAHCIGSPDTFNNQSINSSTWLWNFGDGTTSGALSPTHTYSSPGTYDVQLAITNSETGCVDTLRKKMVIHAMPVVTATGADTCQGSPVQLFATGGNRYVWTPATGLSSDTIPDPFATPSETTTYTVSVVDANACPGMATAIVSIVQPPPAVTWDTTIIIGQFVPLVYPAQAEWIYSWSPSDSLSCTTCPDPVSHPLTDIGYVLTVTDRLGCFNVQSFYDIHVNPSTSLDVPSAFTPNGDGNNDKVYVRGWGIRNLLEFNIYNRFGELVFSTTDLNEGWDGTYKGVMQPTETFAYTVKAETYVEGKVETKKGFVKLLR